MRSRRAAAAVAPVGSPRGAAWPVMMRVPGGRFRMGSELGRPDERPVHEVEVAPFDLAATPVTCRQYAAFLRACGGAAPPCFADPAARAPEQPVTSVTWFEAVAFAQWLAGELGGSWRLPSEAEWERAARGGLEGQPTAWGPALPAGEVPDGPLAGPWAVGRGAPNGYGLYDMGTIVHEWCQDWYAADAYARPAGDDAGEPRAGGRRASRGGSWRHHVRWSSPTARSSLPPDYRYADYGFRVLRDVSGSLTTPSAPE